MKLLILTGMSGAGKSTAFKMLEDMGYYCVDNLPVQLLKSFVELADSGTFEQKIVVGIDVRNGKAMKLLPDILQELDGQQKRFSVLFLDAEDDVLIKRYKETRRNHPLSGRERIAAGIQEERQSIGFLRDEADYVIDTTHLLTRELKEELQKIFVDDAEYKSLFVTIVSFGFKYGIPQDADLVFDVRFLPNPYYVEADRIKPIEKLKLTLRDVADNITVTAPEGVNAAEVTVEKEGRDTVITLSDAGLYTLICLSSGGRGL